VAKSGFSYRPRPQAVISAAARDALPDSLALRAMRQRRAELLKRSFEAYPIACPRCGAQMRIMTSSSTPPSSPPSLVTFATRAVTRGRSPSTRQRQPAALLPDARPGPRTRHRALHRSLSRCPRCGWIRIRWPDPRPRD
jgi:hypothetical protein